MRLSKVVRHKHPQQREDAALPEGIAAVHQLVGSAHEAAFHLTLHELGWVGLGLELGLHTDCCMFAA